MLELRKPARERRFRFGSYPAISVFATVVVLILIAVPLFSLVFSSFRSTLDKLPFEATDFTLGNYAGAFSSSATYSTLANTLMYAAGSVLLGLVLAVPFAWLFQRTNLPGRLAMVVLVLIPMAFPSIVMTMAWILLANPTNGILNVLLRGISGAQGPGPLNIYTIPGMIFVTGIRFVPSMYVMLSATFGRMDPALEEAGRTSGATGWETFRRISIPVMRPAIITVLIYYFVFAVEMFDTPALLGMPRGIYMFSTSIYRALHPIGGMPNYGLASALGMATMALAGALIVFYVRSTRSAERFAVVTGKAYRPSTIDLGFWKWPGVGLVGVYFLSTVLLPLPILVWSSLNQRLVAPSLDALPFLNLANYERLTRYPAFTNALQNTLVVALVTATLTMALAAVVSWLSIRSTTKWSAIPDRLTFLILATPSIVLGAGLVFFYISIPLPIYGTIWIIIIGLSTRFLTFGARQMGPAYLQVHRDLEDAAAASGASQGQTMRRIVLPLVRSAIFAGWLWVFVQSITDVTLPLMLGGVGNELVSVRLYLTIAEESNIGLASAMAVPLILVSAGFTFLVAWRSLNTSVRAGMR